MKFFCFLLIFLFVYKNDCARILGMFPMPAKSHYILGSALMRGLAEKGHEVTMISPFPMKSPPKNYKDIVLKGIDTIKKAGEEKAYNLFEMETMNPIIFSIFMNMMGNEMTDRTLNDTSVQALLKSSAKFDVVIVEQFINDAHKGLAHHFNCPLVSFVTFGSNAWINPLVGNPAPPSYIPELMITFDYQNFFHRVYNAILHVFGELNRHLIFFPSQNRILKKYFPTAPDLSELNYNSSLVLLNSHWSTNIAVPRVPIMIDIGGFHVQPPQKLPKDLQDFLDSAKDGVIYFSMGSALQSANMPVEKRKILLNVFSKLKEKVLWKWEEDSLPGQPKNVKTGKWLPQQDILAHPNVKLFITHGGLLSMIESVYHGKQMLAIPIFGDQKINAAEVVQSGIGLSVPYKQLSEEALLDSINAMLHSSRYQENVKQRSKVMHDRQAKPLDHANYWIEYVIRHQGAPHLKIQGLNLAWYQYYSLDVAVFLIGAVGIVLYVLCVLCSKICSRKKNNKVKKVKQN